MRQSEFESRGAPLRRRGWGQSGWGGTYSYSKSLQLICKDFGTNKEHVKSKMMKSSLFIEILSHVCLVVSQVGIACVSLGGDADARSVVWCSDEFDAGSFVKTLDLL